MAREWAVPRHFSLGQLTSADDRLLSSGIPSSSILASITLGLVAGNSYWRPGVTGMSPSGDALMTMPSPKSAW